MNRILGPAIASALIASPGCTTPASVPSTELAAQVADAERAFARTMADRDHEAFTVFLAEEAIFLFSGSVLRGGKSVADHWRQYFQTEQAPFSWSPETVEVLDSGNLALSTGPVLGPDGARIATYTSIWRQDHRASGGSSSTGATAIASDSSGSVRHEPL